MDSFTYIFRHENIAVFYIWLNQESFHFLGLVKINIAGTEELITPSGLGEKTAEKNIHKREELGSFSSLEDLVL